MQVRIAVVGQGTGEVIQAQQETRLQIEYTPTKVCSFCDYAPVCDTGALTALCRVSKQHSSLSLHCRQFC